MLCCTVLNKYKSLFPFGAVQIFEKGFALVYLVNICFKFQVLVRQSKIWGKKIFLENKKVQETPQMVTVRF